MTIIRAPREERFTVLNRTIIADARLSFRALGLLVYLLDKPDNWRVEAAELSRGRAEGRDAVRSALTELAEAGYLKRQRRQVPVTGQWITETFIYETPGRAEDGFPGVGDPEPGKPAVGAPDVGAPGVSSKTGNEDGNEDCSSTPPTPRKRGEVDEAFEAWWKLYPKKIAGKGQAREKWRKMNAAERLAAMLAIQTHVAWWIEHATDEQFIPAGNVWLNQRRWEDEQPRARLATATVTRPSRLERLRAMRQTETETGT